MDINLSSNVPFLQDGAVGLLAIIFSGLSGGFFAGFFANYYESKRRISDKRNDKYFEHRNSIVQIEHELIPLRVNVARNLTSIIDGINNTNQNNVRFILRFYKLSISNGLGLKLLSLDFINKYAQLYSAIESFNSDIEYVLGMTSTVRENGRTGKVDPSLNDSYKQFLPHLRRECKEIDQKSLELLSISKLAIEKEDRKTKEKYIKDGKEIKYSFKVSSVERKNDEIKKEEDVSSYPGEMQPKFISPFLDLKRVPNFSSSS